MRAMIAAIAGAALLGGCEAVTFRHTVWAAKLDSLPAADCVPGAIRQVPGAALIDTARTRKPRLFGLPPQQFYAFELAGHMWFRLSKERTHGAHFELDYGDEPSKDALARALIARISRVCAVPELEQRVREEHPSDTVLHPWAPV